MKTFMDCIPCFIRQALGSVRSVTDEEEVIAGALKEVCRMCAELDLSKTPPEMGQKIHRLIRNITGNPDPYKEIKQRSNQAAFHLLKEAERIVNESDEPFETAARFAIAGNIMDFALTDKWDHEKTSKSFENVSCRDINTDEVESLRKDIEAGTRILILGDNCGEVVFDRLLIDQIQGKEITYGVKGSPVINDALTEDAVGAGIDKRAEIISNGTDGPGNILDQCSTEFLDIFRSADVVIAKGQANYETLSSADRKIFFLTQIKCPVIARDLRGEVGDWVVKSL